MPPRAGGEIGYSIGIAGDNTAMGRCGGSSAGCKVVMRTQGDCMVAASSSTSKGDWYHIWPDPGAERLRAAE